VIEIKTIIRLKKLKSTKNIPVLFLILFLKSREYNRLFAGPKLPIYLLQPDTQSDHEKYLGADIEIGKSIMDYISYPEDREKLKRTSTGRYLVKTS
jgi:hypothetical protein